MMGGLEKPASSISWFAMLGVTALSYVLYRVVYNVFFHPLRSYPGPWIRAASRLPYTISIFRGDATHRVKALHDRYGQVVRVAPDSLSYTCSQAWSDVYALKQSNQAGNLPKDPKFYVRAPGSPDTISSASDADHRRLRRLQAHAFSEKAIMLQEQYLQDYTGKFVNRIRDEASQNNGVVDIVKWVNFPTTDVIGDLSFGESFGGLDTGKLHPWLDTIFTTLKTFTFIREILRLPSPIVNAALACIPQAMREHQQGAVAFGAEAARRRMARTTDRPDFMSYMMKHNSDRSKGMSQAELEMAAITFIVAGSETTATMISGTMYLLLCNPAVLSDLTEKIRSDFPSRLDMTGINLQRHKYLNSVLKEGMRLYPPAPDALFRTTKDQPAIVAGKFVPPHTSITMNLWAAGRDPINFHRPLEFIPERWMEGALPDFQKDDKAAFKPFSTGPRDCIGKNLAWAEMRLILAQLVWNFDFLDVEPDSRQWIERQKIFSLWEKIPLNARLAPRRDQV
ncbi:isotrichodermin C-15 hydroxylase [Nemania sp. FL0031]|nr:isotrichodermin C-15 hydroxylase [Nemania sp. FL0031]